MRWNIAALVTLVILLATVVSLSIWYPRTPLPARPPNVTTTDKQTATVTPPTPPVSKPGVTTELSQKLDTALTRIAELEAKLKAGSTTRPESETKSQTWGEWFSSWKDFKLPSPSSVGTVPKVATPLPTVPPPPGASPKTKLDEVVAEIEKKVSAKPADTESKSAPAVPPPPATLAPDLKSWAKGLLPKIPSPPSATMASLKGPGGGCSVRKEEITLTDNWVKLTDKCDVVYWYNVKAIIVAKDVDGEFFIKPGTTARVPQEVKLIAGDARFVYSTCPRAEPGTQLGFDCNPIN